MANKSGFSGGYRNDGKKKLLDVSYSFIYISIQKKKSTSEQFLQGRAS